MRLRYISVTYQFGGATPGLERHYRELRESMLRPGNHYAYMQPTSAWRPPMDIHETPDAILVKVELAGIREDAIEITLYENALVVTGQRDDDNDYDEDVCYHEAQVRYGPFRADVALPALVRADEAEATYTDGFLRVRLPKAVPGIMSSVDSTSRRDDSSASSGRHKMNAAGAAVAAPAPRLRETSHSAIASTRGE